MSIRTSSLSINPPQSQSSLQQALRTLRGIRRRYEVERTAHPDMLCNLHVAFGDSDMNWLDAAIEALEKPSAAGGTEAAGGAPRAPGEQRRRGVSTDGGPLPLAGSCDIKIYQTDIADGLLLSTERVPNANDSLQTGPNLAEDIRP